MELFRITKTAHKDEALLGIGAALYGGRFNPVGTRLTYMSTTPELAILETVFAVSEPLRADLHLIKVVVADDLIETLDRDTLPPDWRVRQFEGHPVQECLLEWIRGKRSLGLKVPSAICPESYNVLLNPAFPDYTSLLPIRHNAPHRFDGPDPLRTR